MQLVTKIKNIPLMFRLVKMLAKKNFVRPDDYAREYDLVAKTYDSLWIKRMGKHTDSMLSAALPLISPHDPVLDIACGSGYIIDRVLQKHPGVHVDGVDISEGMLAVGRQRFADKSVTLINGDALSFLKNSSNKYSAIFCGWGISYFDPEELLAAVHDALVPSGVVGFIGNRQGTLAGLKEVYLRVMGKHLNEVDKLLNISSRLAKDKEQFVSWFMQQGFDLIESDDGTEIVSCDTAAKLYSWIQESGAGAGTRIMFKDENRIRDAVIEELAKSMKQNNQYSINHNYVWAVARKR